MLHWVQLCVWMGRTHRGQPGESSGAARGESEHLPTAVAGVDTAWCRCPATPGPDRGPEARTGPELIEINARYGSLQEAMRVRGEADRNTGANTLPITTKGSTSRAVARLRELIPGEAVRAKEVREALLGSTLICREAGPLAESQKRW